MTRGHAQITRKSDNQDKVCHRKAKKKKKKKKEKKRANQRRVAKEKEE